MRQIHVCMANVAQESTMVDLFAWLAAAFQDVGIEVTASDKQMRGDVPNIIFEGGNSGFKKILDANRGKIKLICFVTEPIHEGEFDAVIGNGRERFRDFMSIREHYTGFLTSVPGNVDFLRTIAPATFFEFGYSDRLLSPCRFEEWSYDFSFLGFLSPHRREILAALAQRGVNVHVPGGDTTVHTAYAIPVDSYLETLQRTCINIGLKQHATWKLPSPTKIGRALHSTVGCVIEDTEVHTRQSALVPAFTDVDDFCRKFIPLDRRKIYEEAKERLNTYRSLLPLKREIQRNLDECPSLSA